VKVKQEAGKMESLAEKAYMDLMARGKDIKTARRWCNWTAQDEIKLGY
jgi:hypothetical protein